MNGLQPSEFYKAAPLFIGIEHSRAIVFAVLEILATLLQRC